MTPISYEGTTLPFTSDDPTFPLPALDEAFFADHASTEYEYEGGLFGLTVFDLSPDHRLIVDKIQGVPDCAALTTRSVEEHLAQWGYYGDENIPLAEWLAGWDLDGLAVESEAGPDWTGPCRVWHDPCYYGGTYNAPAPGFAQDEDGTAIVFPDYAAAQAYVHDYYHAPSDYDGIPACNVLAHGQAGADSLTIVKGDWP